MCRVLDNVHHFVNELDCVPRLLGPSSFKTILRGALLIVPHPVILSMLSVTEKAAEFYPFGHFQLLLAGEVHIFDGTKQGTLLQYTASQLLQVRCCTIAALYSPALVFAHICVVQAVLKHSNTLKTWLPRLITDHYMLNYEAKIRACVTTTVPTKFLGGSDSDYRTIHVKTPGTVGGFCFEETSSSEVF